jgi:hypothetical protein
LKSPHNIHTVKCADCHAKGVPQKKRRRELATSGGLLVTNTGPR